MERRGGAPRRPGGAVPGSAPPPRRGSDRIPPNDEWWRRLDAERQAPLGDWPPQVAEAGGVSERRRVVDRRGGSGVATVAALASSGDSVLAVCADALRRRELVERAAAPARFGGGSVAIASGRLADEALRAAARRGGRSGRRSGPGRLGGPVAHARAGRPLRAPGADRPASVSSPGAAGVSARQCPGGRGGFLHLAWGEAEIEFALRVHEEEWPQRPGLVSLYRALGDPDLDLRLTP